MHITYIYIYPCHYKVFHAICMLFVHAAHLHHQIIIIKNNVMTSIQSEREFQSPSERERVPQSHEEGE